MIEAVAEHDDALFEKFVEGQEQKDLTRENFLHNHEKQIDWRGSLRVGRALGVPLGERTVSSGIARNTTCAALLFSVQTVQAALFSESGADCDAPFLYGIVGKFRRAVRF